jgi:hypothetical protein
MYRQGLVLIELVIGDFAKVALIHELAARGTFVQVVSHIHRLSVTKDGIVIGRMNGKRLGAHLPSIEDCMREEDRPVHEVQRGRPCRRCYGRRRLRVEITASAVLGLMFRDGLKRLSRRAPMLAIFGISL